MRLTCMSEIDVSPILEADIAHMSASRFELGDDAGKVTWANCMAFAEEHPLTTDANRQDIRDHFAEYGAWDEQEIEAWTDVELSALVWQEAAASAREFFEHCEGNLRTYNRLSSEGKISARLYITRARQGKRKAWFYVGM